ncbi:MAG: hypothetical protein R2827_12405 [Bdellovibrionales bacterium]
MDFLVELKVEFLVVCPLNSSFSLKSIRKDQLDAKVFACSGKLANWQTGKLANWQTGKLAKKCSGINFRHKDFLLIYKDMPPVYRLDLQAVIVDSL